MPHHNVKTISVLVVDDHEIIRVGLEAVLTTAGYDVCVTASSADARLALAQRLFDLVLTDWQMPDGDGVELCRWIRADLQHHAIKVVLFSAEAGPELAAHALTAGADLCIAKDTRVEVLLDALAQLTRT